MYIYLFLFLLFFFFFFFKKKKKKTIYKYLKDYDNLFSACRRGDLGAVMYFIENCKLNNVSKTILTEKEVINKCEPESMIYINGEKKYVEGYTVLQNAIFGE